MIIVNIHGRLGNQMFEYALYRCLERQGKDVYVDLSCNRQHDEMQGIVADIKYNLDIFNPVYKVADSKIVREWTEEGKRRNFFKRWKYRLFPGMCKCYEEKKTGIFDNNVFKIDDVYLSGYWQSEKYFSEIKDEVITMYKFPDNFSDYQKGILERIQKKYSVSVHVRRGDYLKHPEIYGNTDLDYYRKAMRYIEERKENIQFFMFTDDIAWVSNNFKVSNMIVVNKNYNLIQDNLDMALMTKCNANIVTNSSYSWWGAWLNLDNDKIVIAPKIWEKNSKTTDIWCRDWIKI